MSSTWPEDGLPDEVEVHAPGRVHVTLIDMNGSGDRLDGGIGFALGTPRLRLNLTRASRLWCEGGASSQETAKVLAEAARAAAALGVPETVAVRIHSGIPAHQGFGSGTQIRLALLSGLARLGGRVLTHGELIAMSGRGGTSGIGLHAFLHGGFLVDGGHQARHKASFLPSRFALGVPVPPLLFSHQPPESWGVVLAVPVGAHGLAGVAERDFMAANTPVPLAEVQAVSHTVLMSLLPAVAEGNLANFGRALTVLQDVGWKRRHWRRPELARWRHLVDVLTAEGAAGGGLSSTGPLVYGVYDRASHDDVELRERIAATAKHRGLALESITTTRFGGPAAVRALRGASR